MSDVRTLAHFDASEDKLIVERVQDVAPILDRAKTLHNEGANWSADREYVHAGSLPNVLVEAYCNQHGITFEEWIGNGDHIRRMLNDPSLSGFRPWKGRV